MQRVTKSQRDFLIAATDKYRSSYSGSPAEAYMKTRGLVSTRVDIQSKIDQFRLGYVEDPMPGHEMFRGCISIPYLRWHQEQGWMVVSIRFRRLDDAKPKYMTVAGDQPWLYNTLALIKHSPRVAITEGEIDCITAQVCGIPAVGVPGVQLWKPYMKELFLGYREVFILADGDEPGMDFANKVAAALPNARVIPSPPGEDVNSIVLRDGPGALMDRLK